jgi:hypothetical protein
MEGRPKVASVMTDQGIVVLGIPIPSSSPVFLSVVAVHVLAGLICTIAGIVAMLAQKRRGRHPVAGTIYYWGLVVVFVSMTALSILRWPANNHLFILGIFSFSAAVVGRMARRHAGLGWLRVHVTGMGASYVLLLTAFYVDNGPHLPVWRALPPLAHWLIPSVVGVPILIWVHARHPLLSRARRASGGKQAHG